MRVSSHTGSDEVGQGHLGEECIRNQGQKVREQGSLQPGWNVELDEEDFRESPPPKPGGQWAKREEGHQAKLLQEGA